MRDAADLLLAATERRRVELGKKWKHVYEEAGLTHQTLNRWRNGAPVDPLTDRALSRALHWAPGAREAIAEGRTPDPLGPSGEAPRTDGAPLPPLDQELALAQRLLAATVREMHLSPEEADEVWRRVRLEIEATHRPQAFTSDSDDRNDRAG